MPKAAKAAHANGPAAESARRWSTARLSGWALPGQSGRADVRRVSYCAASFIHDTPFIKNWYRAEGVLSIFVMKVDASSSSPISRCPAFDSSEAYGAAGSPGLRPTRRTRWSVFWSSTRHKRIATGRWSALRSAGDEFLSTRPMITCHQIHAALCTGRRAFCRYEAKARYDETPTMTI